MQLNDDRGVKDHVHTQFAFELKYEGRVDGVDRFSVVNVTNVIRLDGGFRETWQEDTTESATAWESSASLGNPYASGSGALTTRPASNRGAGSPGAE